MKENTGTIRLNSQKQRAKFADRESRMQGLSIQEIADAAGVCPPTVYKFMDGTTRFPRMETVVGIFGALGYDVVFTAKRAVSRGTIQLAA